MMILYFLISVSILVAFHEYGHYYVARKCGVRVKRFAIGFGRPLLTWHNKEQTEFVIGLIPLGGYVKMLDLNDGPLPQHWLPYAFESQSLIGRSLIVLAGPVFNFLLAIAFYTIIYSVGFSSMTPIIGKVAANSIAEAAGIPNQQKVLSIDNESVHSWMQVTAKVLGHVGSDDALSITVQPLTNQAVQSTYDLQLSDVQLAKESWPLSQIGITPFMPPMPPIVSTVLQGGPADEAGMRADDRVLSLDGRPVTHWPQLVKRIRTSIAQPMSMMVLRDNQVFEIEVMPDQQDSHPFIGITVIPIAEPYVQKIQLNPLQSVVRGAELTWQYSVLTLKLMGKMLTGVISLDHLSGPIGIAQGAQSSASMGLLPFLNFLALLSISLGIVNLLPIPTLDGGHLLYYFYEAIFKRPLPQAVQHAGFKLGMIFLFIMMSFAILNDLFQFFGAA